MQTEMRRDADDAFLAIFIFKAILQGEGHTMIFRQWLARSETVGIRFSRYRDEADISINIS